MLTQKLIYCRLTRDLSLRDIMEIIFFWSCMINLILMQNIHQNVEQNFKTLTLKLKEHNWCQKTPFFVHEHNFVWQQYTESCCNENHNQKWILKWVNLPFVRTVPSNVWIIFVWPRVHVLLRNYNWCKTHHLSELEMTLTAVQVTELFFDWLNDW